MFFEGSWRNYQGSFRNCRMKSKTVIVTLVVLIVFAGLYHFSSADFLPWMRYRSIWLLSRNARYNLVAVQDKEGKRHLVVSSTLRTTRVLAPWFGDSRTEITSLDGICTPKELIDVSGYDTSIVSISAGRILPRKPGKTKVRATLPSGVDSLYLQILREEWGLSVHKVSR